MTDTKGLQFSFKIDNNDLARMRQAIKDVTADLTKMASAAAEASKAFGGMMGGFSVGGKPAPSNVALPQAGGVTSTLGTTTTTAASSVNKSLAQVFTENSNAFKNLANVSKDSLKIVTDGLKRSVSEQKAAIASLDRELESLANKYTKVQQAAESAKAGGAGDDIAFYNKSSTAIQTRTANVLAQRSSQARNLAQLEEQMDIVAAASAPPGGGGPPSLADRYNATPFGGRFPTRINGKLARGGVIAGAIGAGVLMGAEDLMLAPNEYVNQNARLAPYRQMAYDTHTGNISGYVNLLRAATDEDFQTIAGQTTSQGVSNTGRGIAGVLQGNISGLSPGAIARGVDSIPQDLKVKLLQYSQLKAAADPTFQANLQKFQAEAAFRMQASNLTGMSEANLSKMFKDLGHAFGASPADIMSAHGSLMAFGRNFANRNIGRGMGASMAGMSPGSVAQLLATSEFGGGNLFGQVMGMGGTGMDIVAAQNLGDAVAKAVQGAGGYVSGEGLFSALNNGDSVNSVLGAQRRIGAIPGAQSVMAGGGDGLGQGVSLLAADQVLGNTGSIYAKRRLAQAASDLTVVSEAYRKGTVPAWLSAYGITADDVKRVSQIQTSNNLAARIVDGGTNDPTSVAARSLLGSRGNLMDWMSHGVAGLKGSALRNQEIAMGNVLADAFPNQVGSAQGYDAFKIIQGTLFGGRGKGKGFGAAGLNGRSGQFRKNAAGGEEDSFSEFTDTTKTILDKVIASMGKDAPALLNSMGTMSTEAADAALSLKVFKEALDQASAGMVGTDKFQDLKRKIQGTEMRRIQKQSEPAPLPTANPMSHNAAR